jgi:hypothetical protein
VIKTKGYDLTLTFKEKERGKRMEKIYLYVNEVGEVEKSERKPNKTDLQLVENGELSIFVIKGENISASPYDSNYPIPAHTFYNESGEVEPTEEDTLDKDAEEIELDKDDEAEDTKEDDDEPKPIDDIINGIAEEDKDKE